QDGPCPHALGRVHAPRRGRRRQPPARAGVDAPRADPEPAQAAETAAIRRPLRVPGRQPARRLPAPPPPAPASERALPHAAAPGPSLQGALLRTAIKFARISSRYGMRRHPIHKDWAGRKGVDYAAPSGTPIHATADGTVEFIGRQNGYGNVIILKNFGKYSTLYAHQSRFAKGLKKGDRVQQGQLIGYVGSTGWATGPHLHYEFRIDNRPVDPLAVDLPVARTLEPADRKAFQDVVALYRPQIELMARLQDSRIQIAQQ